MPSAVDLTGKRFGRLLVTKRLRRDHNLKYVWSCICECGAKKEVTGGQLVSGRTTSCGCYLKERITKHGGAGKRSYNTWRAMVRRCTRATDKDYPRYGGSGIKVCDRWLMYSSFVLDMGEPPVKHTLDRIDPYGNYTPSNCRWASLPQQSRNQRLSKINKTGVVGVSEPYPGKWLAKITVKKHAIYSAVFDTLEEAAYARKKLEAKYWGQER